MSAENVIVMSNDGHAGPRLVKDLRSYCEKKYLEQFDEYAAAVSTSDGSHRGFLSGGNDKDPLFGVSTEINAAAVRRMELNQQTAGHYDARTRLLDMDWDGIAAEVIFHGSLNHEPLPFTGKHLDIFNELANIELLYVGYQIYNRWLADYVSVAPERLLGLIYIPAWDVDKCITEVRLGASAGLRGVNLPAPRPGIAEYDDPVWEPFWSVCEQLNLSLNTHAGVPLFSYTGPQTQTVSRLEIGSWPSRRGMFRLIFGGVFERHPSLNYLLTECSRGWWSYTARDVDQAWEHPTPALRAQVPKRPSEYMRNHLFVGASFMPPSEVQDALAEDYWTNVVWGRDYPHGEGTYKYPEYDGEPSMTKRYFRWAFADCPIDKTRAMLGENGVRAYHLDRTVLAEIAARIGPSLDEIQQPFDELSTGDFFDVYTNQGNA
jgi:predicted TIM-barrel fold metal-dependent hydrolase